MVDTTPLLAQSGNPTAQWAQQALPGALAQAFAAHMAPGDPNGETLSVRIDSIYLGGGGPADPDRMRGEATLGARQTTIRATVDLVPSPVDQTLWEQAHPRPRPGARAILRGLAGEEVAPLREAAKPRLSGGVGRRQKERACRR